MTWRLINFQDFEATLAKEKGAALLFGQGSPEERF
jgi:hypothetical protein